MALILHVALCGSTAHTLFHNINILIFLVACTMLNTLKRHQKKHGKTIRIAGIQEPMSVTMMLRRNTLTGYWSRS
jgi:hypothetical protein